MFLLNFHLRNQPIAEYLWGVGFSCCGLGRLKPQPRENVPQMTTPINQRICWWQPKFEFVLFTGNASWQKRSTYKMYLAVKAAPSCYEKEVNVPELSTGGTRQADMHARVLKR